MERTTKPRDRIPLTQLVFGHSFTDHMLTCEWDKEAGWSAPVIRPYGDLSIPPASSSLHYAIECFEGLKAYKDTHGVIRLFRPHLNMLRLGSSAERLALPRPDPYELQKLIGELVKVDSEWVPAEPGYSLYIRPTLIGIQESLGVAPANKALLFVICSPVGPYYKTGFSAVSLFAENKYVRAWPGGTGCYKLGA